MKKANRSRCNTEKLPLKALIYCRVSSKRQVIEGNGLTSQEQRCRAFAKEKKLEVEKVFLEEGVSGGSLIREQMEKLLLWMDQHEETRYVVIFDDLKRFARGLFAHLTLKKEIMEKRNGILACPNYNFNDSPEGNFIETILAANGQLEREQNQRQVFQKMKSRLEQGLWTFPPPRGYQMKRTSEHGKMLSLSEPDASIIKKALEGFAYNKFNTYQEVADFVNNEYDRLTVPSPRVTDRFAEGIIKNPIYAGIISYPNWDVSPRKGLHEPLISEELYKRNLEKIKSKNRPAIIKNCKEDFPLRGLVYCPLCGKKMTASFPGGARKKWKGRYWCSNKECPLYCKTTRSSVMHQDFLQLLENTKIKEEYLALAKAIIINAWDEKKQDSAQIRKVNQKKEGEMNKQLDELLELKLATASEALKKLLQSRAEKLAAEIDSLEKEESMDLNDEKLGTAVDLMFKMLKNPLLIWNNSNLIEKRTLIYMLFENNLTYDRKSGFGTVKYSDAINVLSSFATTGTPDVEMTGLAPCL